jgi:hypothetical protein
MPDGVDAAIEPMKPSGPKPLCNAMRPDAEREQLLSCDDAVLPLREASQYDIDGGYGAF